MTACVPPGEQCKHQCFSGLTWEVEVVAEAHPEAAAARVQLAHQRGVSAAAPGYHHLHRQRSPTCSEVKKILRDNCCREAGEGGDLVFCRAVAEVMQPPGQIVLTEQFSPSGFGWGQLEIRFLEPALDHPFFGVSLSGHGSLAIELIPPVTEPAHGQINEAVGRAAVPSKNGLPSFRSPTGWDQGEIGNPSQIQQLSLIHI